MTEKPMFGSSPLVLERRGNFTFFTLLPTDGRSGNEWFKEFRNGGQASTESLRDLRPYSLAYHAKRLLESPYFKPTNGLVYRVAVLNGGTLFNDEDRTIRNALVEAKGLNLTRPNIETTCSIRMQLTDQQMEEIGVRELITMHDPVELDHCIGSFYLGIHECGGNGSLFAYEHSLDDQLCPEFGFAFLAPQVP